MEVVCAKQVLMSFFVSFSTPPDPLCCMCICVCTWVYIYSYECGYPRMLRCMWRLKVDMYHLHHLPHFIYWGKISLRMGNSPVLSSLASQLVLGIPFLPSQCRDYGWLVPCQTNLSVVSGHANSGCHAWPAATSPTMIHFFFVRPILIDGLSHGLNHAVHLYTVVVWRH